MHQQRRDPLEGAVVDGRYVVHSRLARGGMSTVYVATDRRLDRRVALKVLYPHLADEPGFIERFEQEAKSAARLSHPHVVGVLDQGVDDVEGQAVAYLVMEFVRGRTLRDVLRAEGRLTPRHALRILDAVVQGLAAAHEAGLIHRDVKPENVLLSETGSVKIADFGLARAVSATTGTATLVGTVAYLSPELVLGRPAEAQSDIYSTGIMLYELLTGRQPFTGETPIQVAIQHAQADVPAPSELLPGLAADIDELVLWCTSRDPEDRPVDGTALLGELRHIRDSLTDEELDFVPADTSPPATDQDQLTVAAVPRLSFLDASTRTVPGHAAGQGNPQPAVSPPQGAEDSHGPGQGEHRTEYLGQLPSASGAHHTGSRPGSSGDATGVIRGDHSATRVIGAMPPRPPLSASPSSSSTSRHGDGGAETVSLASGWRTDTEEHTRSGDDGPTGAGQWQHGQDDAARPTNDAGDPTVGTSRGGGANARRPTGASSRPLSRRQQAREAQRPQKSLQGRTARRSLRVLVVLLVLLAGVVAGAGWFFGAGPAGVVSLPDVANVPLAEARAALDEQGLGSLSTEEVFDDDVLAGLVIATQPGAFAEIRRYETVELIVSKGPQLFAVPDVVGTSEVDAAAALGAAGLALGALDEEYSETVAAGDVIRQTPAEGTERRRATGVDLVVSLGPAPIAVPDVTGLPEEEAVAVLEDAGLEIGSAGMEDYSRTVPAGAVISQSPAGVDVQRGTPVSLTLSLGPRLVEVPNVFSLSESRAVEALEAAGFVVEIDYTFGGSVLGLVAGQSETGEQPEGSTIRLTVT